jgi:hypothetical protein
VLEIRASWRHRTCVGLASCRTASPGAGTRRVRSKASAGWRWGATLVEAMEALQAQVATIVKENGLKEDA